MKVFRKDDHLYIYGWLGLYTIKAFIKPSEQNYKLEVLTDSRVIMSIHDLDSVFQFLDDILPDMSISDTNYIRPLLGDLASQIMKKGPGSDEQ